VTVSGPYKTGSFEEQAEEEYQGQLVNPYSRGK